MRVKNKQPIPSFVMESSEDQEESNFVQHDDHQHGRQNDNQHDNQHDLLNQYSFDEQFKQLYELSADPKRKEFLDDLFLFMTKRGTPINRIPIMAKQVLDLYELYRMVVNLGGLVEVVNRKIWREVTKGLRLPSSITSAAFTLRTQYMKYLYPYECEKERLSTPEELQQAIDGNRREGRRSSYGHYSDMVGSPGAGGSGCSGNSLGGNNGSTGNGGPSIGGLSSHNITPSLHTALPLSLVAGHLKAANNNSGATSSEEDNLSIQSLSLKPLLTLASAQAEALNLEVKPNINGHLIGLNSIAISNNQNNNSSSSSSSLSNNNLENDTICVNVNGNIDKDSNNNNKNNDNKNNGHDRGESINRINNNLLEKCHRKDSLHDTPGIDLTTTHSSSSSSSSSTSHNNRPIRNLSDDERLLINAGMPAAHIKIANPDRRGSLENSLLLSMEINDMIYSGILYPRNTDHNN